MRYLALITDIEEDLHKHFIISANEDVRVLGNMERVPSIRPRCSAFPRRCKGTYVVEYSSWCYHGAAEVHEDRLARLVPIIQDVFVFSDTPIPGQVVFFVNEIMTGDLAGDVVGAVDGHC